MAATIDGIVNEPTINFVGKDGFFWWVGEVEDNEDKDQGQHGLQAAATTARSLRVG